MRSSEYKYLYATSRWKKLSLGFRMQNPKCVFCGSPSRCTDHIIQHKGDVKLFYDWNNLQALCIRCHNSVKYRMELGQVEGKDFIVNNEASEDGTPKAKSHPWNK